MLRFYRANSESFTNFCRFVDPISAQLQQPIIFLDLFMAIKKILQNFKVFISLGIF